MQTLKLRALFWLSISVLASACGRQQAYTVDGVHGKFCVPKGYPPKGVWFIPDDTSDTPHGFSFMGCGLLSGALQKTCELPDGLISVTVMPPSVTINQTWAHLKSAALFQSVVRGRSATFETESKTGRLKVYNADVWPAWFIWKKGGDSRRAMDDSLHDSDELMMSCSGAAVFPGGNGGLGSGNEYVCERYVRGKNYALKYKFVSEVPMPDESQTQELERAIFRQVDMWKCPD